MLLAENNNRNKHLY